MMYFVNMGFTFSKDNPLLPQRRFTLNNDKNVYQLVIKPTQTVLAFPNLGGGRWRGEDIKIALRSEKKKLVPFASSRLEHVPSCN